MDHGKARRSEERNIRQVNKGTRMGKKESRNEGMKEEGNGGRRLKRVVALSAEDTGRGGGCEWGALFVLLFDYCCCFMQDV